jgi:NAD(P)-dependent dehydrogenase (short-subunit alcohol dehydrogenase family)
MKKKVLGSGPGIGVSVASTFAVRGFTHIALISRDASRLSQDEDTVLTAIQERGYTCQVKTWSCDMTDDEQLKKTLGEVEKFGTLECVLYNAARVAGKPPLEESGEEIEADFKVRFFFHFLLLFLMFPLEGPCW